MPNVLIAARYFAVDPEPIELRIGKALARRARGFDMGEP
jgi:hypothetical protein